MLYINTLRLRLHPSQISVAWFRYRFPTYLKNKKHVVTKIYTKTV